VEYYGGNYFNGGWFMKKQSEWMKGLLAAERMVNVHGVATATFVAEKDYHPITEFNNGIFDYLSNYKERNNV
jgi:hypothetical protein